MAHFAQLDENNRVLQVCVVDNVNAPGPFPESELHGQSYLARHGFVGRWVQTSYNGNFRGCYAGIGMTFDEIKDEFVGENLD